MTVVDTSNKYMLSQFDNLIRVHYLKGDVMSPENRKKIGNR